MVYKDRVVEALRCFSDPLTRGDYFSLYSDDVVFHGYKGVKPGIASVREYYASFWSAFPDARVLVEDFIEEADKLTLRFTVTGTHLGPLFGMTATGKTICLPGIAILRFANGKCVERWTVTDSAQVVRQLESSLASDNRAGSSAAPSKQGAPKGLCRRPDPSEYPPYAEMYMRLVHDGSSVLDQLRHNRDHTVCLIANLPEEVLVRRYAPGKWTVKDILCHISDDERIYVYRALRFSRLDDTALPGFDQDWFADHARANVRTTADLIQEFVDVRAATLTFFASLDEEDLLHSGIADGKRSTVRALAFHIAGHELHHLEIVRRFYLPGSYGA